MTSFTTGAGRHSFEIDGKPYTLPLITYGEVESFDAARSRDDVLRSLLAKHADKRTVEAIKKLSMPQVAQLLREWLGSEPGESSASAE